MWGRLDLAHLFFDLSDQLSFIWSVEYVAFFAEKKVKMVRDISAGNINSLDSEKIKIYPWILSF